MPEPIEFNPVPPEPIQEVESEEEIILPPEEPKIVNPMVEKFKQSFYKIHGRYPSDEEVSASLGSLYKEDDNNTVIDIDNNNIDVDL